MPLTKEQIENLKEQLKSQVQHLPEEQKKEAIKQIESLSPESLELLLKQSQEAEKSKSPDIFRKIINKEIPAFIIDENKFALAVLDINPVSLGHTIIIPKIQAKTSMDLPNQALSMAKKISKRIISKLKAKSTEIQTEFKFNEIIINIIPIYEQKLSLSSPRTKASEEELNNIAKKLRPQKKKQKEIKKEEPKTQPTEIIKLPKKIP
ncbi:MAG: HIT domain-containing protein [Candidatus Pacearchaeota archaeon]|nr:HIT domain-containing protein [Candidatus Pacearchaeota archaeon]